MKKLIIISLITFCVQMKFAQAIEHTDCVLIHEFPSLEKKDLLTFSFEKSGKPIKIDNTNFYRSFESPVVEVDGVNNEAGAPYLPEGKYAVRLRGQYLGDKVKVEIIRVWRGYSYFSGRLASIVTTPTQDGFSVSAGEIKDVDPMVNPHFLTAHCKSVQR